MSPNSSIIHCGLDVAKSSLDLHCQGRNLIYPNDPAGLRALIAFLLEVPSPATAPSTATATNWNGKRWIQGGRAALRKPSKVALITLARHLLNHLNSIIKNYHFKLAR